MRAFYVSSCSSISRISEFSQHVVSAIQFGEFISEIFKLCTTSLPLADPMGMAVARSSISAATSCPHVA